MKHVSCSNFPLTVAPSAALERAAQTATQATGRAGFAVLFRYTRIPAVRS